jgi:hypothetical protein
MSSEDDFLASSGDEGPRRPGKSSRAGRQANKEKARWERSLQERNIGLFGSATTTRTTEELNRIAEARKRTR